MNDTPPQITEKMRAMIQQKTPAERLAMGCSMFDFSKQLITNSILREHPDYSGAFLRRDLFLRFYGQEFDTVHRNKIAEHFVQIC